MSRANVPASTKAARADEPTAADLAELSLEELMSIEVVVAASRHEEDPRKAPSSVTVITAEDMRRYGYRTLAEERLNGALEVQYVSDRPTVKGGAVDAYVVVNMDLMAGSMEDGWTLCSALSSCGASRRHRAVTRRKGQSASKRRGAAFVLAVLALASAAVPAAAQPVKHEVKAAFLYHFAQYVEWPATAFETSRSPFIIGVAGDDGFLTAISSAVADKSVAGHRIVVKAVDTPAETRGCHMVFVTPSEAPRLQGILVGLDALPVLAVGDVPGFAEAGGAIGFAIQDGKVVFRINTAAARRAGLRISSKLLRLAEIVDAD